VPLFDGVYTIISQFAQSNHVAIIFNGDDAEFHPNATNYFNAAFIVQANGICTGVYHKQKLVIFGEYIPLVRWLPFLKYLTPIGDGWTPGTNSMTFELARWSGRPREPVISLNGDSPEGTPRQTVQISPLICFEDVFPDVARNAANDDLDFLVNLTNDGWFRDSAEQWQHMANAVFRAVENGVPLVRAANNGITCWIDAHGRVQNIFRDATGSEYGFGAAVFEIPLRPTTEKSTPTFYHRHGDWFGWACVVVTLASILSGWLKRHRKL
jgi:apolipoprotein N-acyltransferase